MKNYICIISYENGEIIDKIEVTGKGERSIDRVDRGINININHEKYYTVEMNEQELKDKK
jgi:hypothetical protein